MPPDKFDEGQSSSDDDEEDEEAPQAPADATATPEAPAAETTLRAENAKLKSLLAEQQKETAVKLEQQKADFEKDLAAKDEQPATVESTGEQPDSMVQKLSKMRAQVTTAQMENLRIQQAALAQEKGAKDEFDGKQAENTKLALIFFYLFIINYNYKLERSNLNWDFRD